jgi:hypothetical protein
MAPSASRGSSRVETIGSWGFFPSASWPGLTDFWDTTKVAGSSVTEMSEPATQRSLREKMANFVSVVSAWVVEHQTEIEAVASWSIVNSACSRARLYAPMDAETWVHITSELRVEGSDDETVILDAYGPGGVGSEALRAELIGSPLLAARRSQVGEVLDSLADGRYYVAACGTLPLVEYVVSKSAGRWDHPHKHVKAIQARLHTEDFRYGASVFLDYAALQMVMDEIPRIWEHSAPDLGATITELNRHRILHGTGLGWDDARNATRAVLLLAAAAHVGGPLFGNAPGNVAGEVSRT